MDKDKLFTDNLDFDIPCWYDNPPGCPHKGYECKRRCTTYKCMNALINNCGQPNAKKFLVELKLPKEDTKEFLRLKQIKDNIVEWVEKGSNLFISSNNIHTGKTTWALKLLYRYFDQIWIHHPFIIMGYYLYVPEFLFRLRDYEYKSSKEFKKIDYILKNCPLVVWDNINYQTLTPQEQVALDIYLNKRSLDVLSNIFVGKHLDRKDQDIILGPVLSEKLSIVENINFKTESYREF